MNLWTTHRSEWFKKKKKGTIRASFLHVSAEWHLLLLLLTVLSPSHLSTWLSDQWGRRNNRLLNLKQLLLSPPAHKRGRFYWPGGWPCFLLLMCFRSLRSLKEVNGAAHQWRSQCEALWALPTKSLYMHAVNYNLINTNHQPCVFKSICWRVETTTVRTQSDPHLRRTNKIFLLLLLKKKSLHTFPDEDWRSKHFIHLLPRSSCPGRVCF